MELDGITHNLSAGFSICFSPGPVKVRARHDPDRPLQVFYSHFEVVGNPVGVAPLAWAPVSMEVDAQLLESLHAFIESPPAEAGNAIREALLWCVLLRREVRGGKPFSLPEDRIRHLLRSIRENPAAGWNVDELARRAGLSTGHFRRIFRSLTGQAPLEYVLDCRMRRACYYLEETRVPIGEIAIATGYADIYYFSRQFKERLGCTPTDYRRRRRRDRVLD